MQNVLLVVNESQLESINRFVYSFGSGELNVLCMTTCVSVMESFKIIRLFQKHQKNCVEKKFDCKIQSATEFKASNKPNLRSQILIISLQQFYQILCLFALYCASFRSIKLKMTHRFLQFQRIIFD